MSDKSDKPDKIPFNRADPAQHKIRFNRAADPEQAITNPDGSPLREKDNAQQVLKPEYSNKSAPNLG